MAHISSLGVLMAPTSYYPWSLDKFVHEPSQLPGEYTVLQTCLAIGTCRTTIVISVPPDTHLHLSEVKH